MLIHVEALREHGGGIGTHGADRGGVDKLHHIGT